MSPGKTTVQHDKPCNSCEQNMVDLMAEFLEANGVPLDSVAESFAAHQIPYEVAQPEGALTERVLSQMEEDASYFGYAATGQPHSFDMDLRLGGRMQQHIPVLVDEIRRLRSLVPEEFHFPESKPTYPGPKVPPPPFPLP